jgi:4-azaleucine resistance transporter AzlC
LNEKTKALKAAFPHTIPVFTGFIFLGIAYGITMNDKGFGVGWTFLMSLMAFAGSAQYVAITFLTSAFNPVYALIMTLMVNVRHLFYGISLLDKYKGTGKFKPYLIFGLCDETFSIVCSTEPPEGADRNWFMYFITLLDHSYWVLGSVIGAILGSLITFNTKGLDFVLTALFVVIFVGQWKTHKDHKPAVIGVVCSVICLVIFGQSNFIIPSMISIISVLTLLPFAAKYRNKYLDGKEPAEEELSEIKSIEEINPIEVTNPLEMKQVEIELAKEEAR